MPSLPVSRRRALVLAAAALALLAVAGRTLGGAGAAAEQPAQALVAEPAAAAPRLTVHVAGAVRRPGLYRLAEGKRVADAVARAGGATAPADTAAINLAAPLADGMQVLVPRRVPGSGGKTVGGRVSLSSATRRRTGRAAGYRPRHRAEDPRLPRCTRRLSLGRRSRRDPGHRPSPHRAAARCGVAVIARGWPTLLVLAACLGLALANAIRAPALVVAALVACAAVSASVPACAPAGMRACPGPRRLVVGKHAPRSARCQRPRAGDRPLGSRDGGRHRPGAAVDVRAPHPRRRAALRRALAPREGAARAAARPLAAPGCDPRPESDSGGAARPGKRLRRTRLARPSRRSRRAPRAGLAARRPPRRHRRRLGSPPRARCARDRPCARGRAACRAGRNRPRRGRGADGRAPRRLQGLRALSPARGVGPEHHLPGAWRPRARLAARHPSPRGRGGGDRRDLGVRPRRRLAAVGRPRRRRGWPRLARLAALAAARPLALPRARSRGPARVDTGEPARARLPALVRRGRRDLPARAAPAAGARGLPAACVAPRGARGLDCLRCRHRADPLAPVRQRARLLAAGERARHPRDRAAARNRARRLADRARAADRRARARLAQRLAGRLHRRLRASDRSPAVRAGRVRRGGLPAAGDSGRAARAAPPARVAAPARHRWRGRGAPGPARLAAAAGGAVAAADRLADHVPRRRPGRLDPAAGARGCRARRSGAARGGRRPAAAWPRHPPALGARAHAPAARPHRWCGERAPARRRRSRPRSRGSRSPAHSNGRRSPRQPTAVSRSWRRAPAQGSGSAGSGSVSSGPTGRELRATIRIGFLSSCSRATARSTRC